MNGLGEASNAQASKISDVTTTVSTLDQITQENAAIAERSASGAGLLASQSDAMLQVVKTFQTTRGSDIDGAKSADAA